MNWFEHKLRMSEPRFWLAGRAESPLEDLAADRRTQLEAEDRLAVMLDVLTVPDQEA